MPMYIGVWQEYQMGRAAEERARKLDEWKKANASCVDDILTNNRIAPIALQKKDPIQPRRRRARPARGVSPPNVNHSSHASSSSESRLGQPSISDNKDPVPPTLRVAESLSLPRLGVQYFAKNKPPMTNALPNAQITSEVASTQANAPPSKHRHIQHFTGLDVGGIPVEAVVLNASADTNEEGRSNSGLRSLPPVREAVAPRHALALPPPQYSPQQVTESAPRSAASPAAPPPLHAAGPSGAAIPTAAPSTVAPDTASQQVRQQQDQQGQYLRAAALGVGGSVAALLAEAKAQAPGTRPKERRWIRLSGDRGERQALYRDYMRARRGSHTTQHSNSGESSKWPRWCADAAKPQQPPHGIAIPVHAPALRVLHPDLRSHLDPQSTQSLPAQASGSPNRTLARAPSESGNPHFRSHYAPNASVSEAPQRTFTVDRVLTGGALNGDYRILYQRAAAPSAASSLPPGLNATQSMAQMRVARLMQLYGMQLPHRDAAGAGGSGPASARDASASAQVSADGQGIGDSETRTDYRYRMQGTPPGTSDSAPFRPAHMVPSSEQRAWEQFQRRRESVRSAARAPACRQAPVQLAPLPAAEGARAFKRTLHSSASAPAQPRGTLRRPAHAARGGAHKGASPTHAHAAVDASGTAAAPAPADSGAARLDMASLRAQLLQLNPHLGAVLAREAPQHPGLPHSHQDTRAEVNKSDAMAMHIAADNGNATGHAALSALATTSEWASGERGLNQAADAVTTEGEVEAAGSGDRGAASTDSGDWGESTWLDDSFAAGLAAIDAVLEEEERW